VRPKNGTINIINIFICSPFLVACPTPKVGVFSFCSKLNSFQRWFIRIEYAIHNDGATSATSATPIATSAQVTIYAFSWRVTFHISHLVE
jgi:hypothetical protein